MAIPLHVNIRGSLEGKVALVTGGTSGIGRAIAIAFANAGVRVVIGDIRDRPVGGGLPTADLIQKTSGKALFVETDVSQKSQVEVFVKKALDEFGQIDILVNNAGLGHLSRVEHTPEDVLRHLVEVNFYGLVYGVQSVLPIMRAQSKGHIINISSGTAVLGLPFASVYSATKAAIFRFSESLRYELENTGIHVSVVFPDFTSTDLALEVTTSAESSTRTLRLLNPEWIRQYGSPLGKVQSPEDVAQAVLGCTLKPRKEIYLSRRIRFNRLFQLLFPVMLDREAGRIRALLQPLLSTEGAIKRAKEKPAPKSTGSLIND